MALSIKDKEKASKRIDQVLENDKSVEVSVKKNELPEKMKSKSITMDDNTERLVKKFGKKRGLQFSAALRVIVNELYIKSPEMFG